MDLAEKLYFKQNLDDAELTEVLQSDRYDKRLFELADKKRREIYEDKIYIRGLIEFTNYCKNNCFYCGIRCGNKKAVRFRLTKEEILSCCTAGYELGFRTFVLQGGEDLFFTDEKICDIVSSVKNLYPDCAVTLSVGEKSRKSYKAYFDAGAGRYLLRHETADSGHYQKLHPQNMSLDNRKRCLWDLKEIGYQVGSGFMVGSPYQTVENLICDLRFLQELKPQMIGIGPYITHCDTPFANIPSGSLDLTLRLVAVLRLAFPYALIPATTALATLSSEGRILGLKAGANVVMPNLSPKSASANYTLYDNKAFSGEESAKNLDMLKLSAKKAGYTVVTDIGNPVNILN